MEFDDLIKNMDTFQQGMQQGREMAIKKYDIILLELWAKMENIELKIDKVLTLLN